MKKLLGHTVTILLCIIAYSCSTRKHYAVKGEFRYLNALQQPVTIRLHQGMNQRYATYNIQPGETVAISTMGDTYLNEPADPQSYVPALIADTTVLQLNDTLCYTEYKGSGQILHNINSYTHERRGDKDYIFYFTIDSTINNLGTKCLQ